MTSRDCLQDLRTVWLHFVSKYFDQRLLLPLGKVGPTDWTRVVVLEPLEDVVATEDVAARRHVRL